MSNTRRRLVLLTSALRIAVFSRAEDMQTLQASGLTANFMLLTSSELNTIFAVVWLAGR